MLSQDELLLSALDGREELGIVGFLELLASLRWDQASQRQIAARRGPHGL